MNRIYQFVVINHTKSSFWTSTQASTKADNANYKYITDDTPFLNGGTAPKLYGLSIRCVKNTGE